MKLRPFWNRHDGGFSFDLGTMFLYPTADAGGGGAGAGGGSGGGAGAGTQQGGGDAGAFTPPDMNNPAVKSWFEQQTTGLRTNRDQILAEKREFENKFKGLSEKVKGFGDIDKALEFHAKLQSDEEKKLFAEGKFDEVLTRRTQDMQKRHKEVLDGWETKHAATEKKVADHLERIKGLTIDRDLTTAAMEAGVQKTALEDLIARGRGVFSLSEEFKPVALDKQGNPVFGPDGKTPLTAKDWIESLKAKAPHFFPGSSGAGSGGGPGTGGPGNEITLTPEQLKNMPQSDYNALRQRADKEGKTIRLL